MEVSLGFWLPPSLPCDVNRLPTFKLGGCKRWESPAEIDGGGRADIFLQRGVSAPGGQNGEWTHPSGEGPAGRPG